MKNYLLFAYFLFCHFASNAQNPACILAPKYIPDITLPFPILLPTASPINTNPMDGYDGQAAKSAQNIIVDNNNEIVFFIIDQYIYGRNGEFIDAITSSDYTSVTGIVSEIVVVPAPDDCNTFYIISSKEPPVGTSDVTFALGCYAKLVIKYDAFNQILPGSGLEVYDTDYCVDKSILFSDIIGPNYYSENNIHDEGPRYAVVERANTNDKFLFLLNGHRLFRLKINSTGIVYDNYFIDITTLYPAGFQIDLNTKRLELEMIKLSNGNYRVAFANDHTLVNSAGNVPAKSVFIFDLDNNGNILPTTANLASYPITNPYTSLFQISGIELSSDGSHVYVSHIPDNNYPGSLDVFDITGLTPVKTVISNTNNFQYSQIEASFGNTMLIPHSTGIARISNANSTFNFTMYHISLGNYPISSPYPITNTNNGWLRILQDQVDGMDYSSIDPNEYGAAVYNTVSANATWTPNGSGAAGNPLINGTGTIAYIKDELRVKAGTTLTIQNLEIRFAPGARLVVENSSSTIQGGKLIINNTILTNDDRCGKNEMWMGVEVWGNQSQAQGTMSNSKQGRFIMSNNSKIENAWIGTLVGKRNSTIVQTPYVTGNCLQDGGVFVTDEVVSPLAFDNAGNGGIVQTSNSEYLNNQWGVYFRSYLAFNGVNNLSKFSKTNFTWNGLLIGAVSLQAQARLQEVKGISFRGCKFENQTPNLYSYTALGYGIFAQESQFYVSPQCNVIVQVGQPCTSQTASIFKDLRFGIYTTNANSLSFTCSESNFINNQYGIYVRGTQLEKVTQNKFEIRESNTYQSVGLAMYASSGYQVEANKFYEYNNPQVTDGTGLSYGIVVNNSGAASNEIYHNEFHNLKIGGQTERKNAIDITTTNNPNNSSVFTLSGLHWKCNDFQSAIIAHDLTLMYGSMGYLQGNATGSTSQLDATRRAALNRFSLTGEPFANAHDIFVSPNSQEFQYSYIDAPRNKPDSYTPNLVDINDVLWNALPITNDLNGCPSTLISKTQLIALSDLAQIKTDIDSKQTLLDNGASTSLLTLIATNNYDVVKNTLLTASPYLSDKVLLAYIASKPPSGHLKQVMIANSQLSNDVKLALSTYSMPNGIANQIAAKQNGYSERTKLYFELSYLKEQYDAIYNERIRDALLSEDENANFDILISILKEAGDIERLKLLLSTYIVNKDNVKAEETRTAITQNQPVDEFIDLSFIQEDISKEVSTYVALDTKPEIVSKLQYLKDNAVDKRINEKAASILEMHSTVGEAPDFLTANTAKMLEESNSIHSNNIDLYRAININVYPNPTTGMVTIDYPEQQDGELKIEVVDITGKVVYGTTFTNTNGEQIDLRTLDKGMYLLRISMDDALIGSQKLKLQ